MTKFNLSMLIRIYTQRDGTPAAKMKDNVPEDVKKARLQRLNKK